MLQVRKNEISLRQWSGGSAQLRTLEGTLVAKFVLCWQQCFLSHSIKVRGLCYQQQLLAGRCIYLPRCLRSTVICGKTLLPATWREPLKICCHVIAVICCQLPLPCQCCHVIVTKQRSIVEHSLPSFATCLCRQRSGLKWTASSSLHDTRTVNLTLVHCVIPVNKLPL